MTHFASEISAVVKRTTDFANEVVPYFPTTQDSTEELLALRVALMGEPGERLDHGLIGLLRDVLRGIDSELNERIGRRKAVVGNYEIERTPGTTRKSWNHGMAAKEVATAAYLQAVTASDKEDLSGPEGADAVVNALLRCAGFSYWRTGECSKLGVPVDLFCEREPGTPGVIVRHHWPKEEDE